uniref:Cadmium-inducible lysosomal protein CDR-3 n=1 Tax=Caenorhabditis elegans TaxID=6239 RepID=Q5XXC0_CAEEL|nr:cadmium-inducible lysosomal protein CDR-3 [Caenorhabditis elegans]
MISSCAIKVVFILSVIGIIIYKKFFKKPSIRAKPEPYKKDYNRGTVYLYQFKRTKKCPNLSPFCMKVEVLCRAYKVPYEICDEKLIWSRNGTLPFIELNGEHIADTDLIEVRLREHFNISSLPKEKEAQSVAITRLADNHLFSVLLRYKTSDNDFYYTLLGNMGVPKILQPICLPFIKAAFVKKAYERSTRAIGDFEQTDLDDILHRDLQTIQDYLGEQKFLFGDEVKAADAAVFGQLATVIYPFRCKINDILENDFPQLLEYCERVRKEIYPNDFVE